MHLPAPQRRQFAALWCACSALAGVIALALWLSVSAIAHAQAPAVGTVIDNQAFAEFTPATGAPQRIASNNVSLKIGQVAGALLAASQLRIAAPGRAVYFGHTLTNTGNGWDTFTLDAVNAAAGLGADFAFSSVLLYLDANGDGVPDSVTPLPNAVTLAPGQTLSFVMVVVSPTTASNAQVAWATITATGSAAAAFAGQYAPIAPQAVNDKVTISMGPVIELKKTFSAAVVSSPAVGSAAANMPTPIWIEIAYQNTGFASANNVVLSDVVPGAGLAYNSAGLRYVPDSATWNITALTDAPGGDPVGISYEYATTGIYANTVRAVIASVPAGRGGVLRFAVTVAAGLPPGNAVTTNIAQASYADSAQAGHAIVTQSSNTASVTIAGRVAGADLTLTKTSTAMVVPGQCAVFVLQVSNQGSASTSGAITVTDALPAGLEYLPSCDIRGVVQTSGGVGWTCPSAATTGAVRCSTLSSLRGLTAGAPSAAQPLRLVVRANAAQLNPPLPALNAQPNTVTVTNTASVSNDSEPLELRDNNTATAPLVVGPAATVRGRVWLDANHDRAYNPAGPDVGVPGWRVELLDPATGKIAASVLSQADGSYVATGLLPGRYHVRFIDPASNIVNGRPVCNESGLNSAVSANCAKTDFGQLPGVRSVEGGALEVDLAAGDTIAQMSLPLDPSGVIYDSLTRKPIAGAKVDLQLPAGFKPTLHLIGGGANVSQVTGASGWYQFILTGSGTDFCTALPNGCIFGLSITPPAGYRAPVSAFLPASASVGGCAQLSCIDPTGLAAAGAVYTVQTQITAPAIGQATPYFLRFQMAGGDPDVVNNHIPLDPEIAFGKNVLIEKKASKVAAEVGDFVDYSVRIKNGAFTPLLNLKLVDQLPQGFRFVSGSAKLAGQALPNPAITNPAITNPAATSTARLEWVLGTLGGDQTLTLSYRVRIEFAASGGDGINRATAYCPSAVYSGADAPCSNTGEAKVRITDGVLSGKPMLVGKVFLDCNRDRVQNEGDNELGVPGVRLMLQDGTHVTTDEEGKYSLYGLAARSYVLKLDPLSLPIAWSGVMLSNRNAGETHSRFVDLKYGELHKANFADGVCDPTTVTEVQRRREQASKAQVDSNLWSTPLDANPAAKIADAKAQASAGAAANASPATNVAAANAANSVFAQSKQQALINSSTPQTAPSDKAQVAGEDKMPTLEKILETANYALDFINLRDGQILPNAQSNVQIKAAKGASIVFTVNGVEVPSSRIGKRSVNDTTQTQAWEFIAVGLQAGVNHLNVDLTDALGNPRGSRSIAVHAPGDLAQLTVMPEGKLIADSRAVNRVRVLLLDANGLPVTQRIQLSLKLEGMSANAATPARVATVDLDPLQDGVQIFAQDGSVLVDLIAPDTPTTAKLHVEAGSVKHAAELSFLPNLRSMVGVGIVDAALQLHKLKASQLGQNGRGAFEDELRCFGRPTVAIAGKGQWDCLSKDFGDKGRVSVQTALYFKGAVKGEYLLTLAYDNAKDTKARVFRDIAPDEYYPVYGDSSQRGFDANSTEKLFVRVDKGSEYLLYGDFATQSTDPARQLTQYSRTLTGLKSHLESKDAKGLLDLFATRDSLKQKVVEFAANGTSGPFSLAATGVVNSELVEVLVRDRNAPGTILTRSPLTRFVDYEIEPFTGRLLLRAPQPSLTADLNPVSVRVVYEQEEAIESYWTLGAQGSYKVADKLEVGGTAMQERRPNDTYTLLGAHVRAKLGEHSVITTEIARTRADNLGAPKSGAAARAELVYKNEAWEARLQAQTASAEFNNPSSNAGKDKTEVSGKLSYKLDPTTTIAAELLHSEDRSTQAKRDGMAIKYEKQLDKGVKLEAGARHIASHEPSALAPAKVDDVYTSVRGKLTVPVSAQSDAYLEVEKAVADNRKLIAVGGDYRLSNRGRIYARHEFANTLGSDFGITAGTNKTASSLLGLDAPLTDTTQAFSEYRLKDSLAGNDAQAAIGLRQSWLPIEGLRLNSTIERTHILSTAAGGAQTGPSTAFTLAGQYTQATDWKATARLERRAASTQDTWLNTMGYAYKVNRDWTMLARSVLSMQHNNPLGAAAANELNKYRVQVGAAYRQTDGDVWNALGKIERRGEIETGVALKRTVSLLSAHGNYQVDRQWWLSAHVAVKSVSDVSGGTDSRSRGLLAGARLTYELSHEWDTSVLLLGLSSGDNKIARNHKLGLGLELGYRVQENLWLSAGYNIWGVKDRDLTSNEYTDTGFYLRMRYKFDETLFDRPRDRMSE